MTFNVNLATLDSLTLSQILTQWQATTPSMGVLALLPEAEKQNLPILQQACRAHDIPLCGGIFPALVTDSGFLTAGVWLLRFDEMPPVFILPGLTPDDTQIGNKIAAKIEECLVDTGAPIETPTLFLLFDAMVPNISSILDQLYLCLSDQVRYAGVNAGSETFQAMPCLFDAEHLFGDGVLGLLLSHRASFVLEHSYPAPEHVMVATSSENNRIMAIDWRPAFDVYQEIIGREYGIALNPENFYSYVVHFPFGILRANGEVVVRVPVALTEDGSIFCVGEVPENAMLALLRAPSSSEGNCVDNLIEALNLVEDRTIVPSQAPLVTFYCAGRRLHLGMTANEELSELKRQSGTQTLVGALSLGEIGARASDYPVFHNAALVCKHWIGA